MLTRNSQSLLLWTFGTNVWRSEETVHAFDCFTAIIHALGPDTLAAGVVEPAVLRSSHRLTILFTLTNGHTVVEVDHRAHALLSVVAGVDAVPGHRDVLRLIFE